MKAVFFRGSEEIEHKIPRHSPPPLLFTGEFFWYSVVGF